ncbi:MAG: hypothetical protein HJJLKODD_02988 [Phycisphaerae bacterium]|nr:hypothetical protein [Phycisphaerae bacterium]
MGHTRLGELPKTRKWAAVVAELLGQSVTVGNARIAATAADDINHIARLALDAAQTGLDQCVRDAGLNRTFYLLTQIVLAAREENWSERLSRVGIYLSEEADLWELTGEMQRVIDQHLRSRHELTDISEIAQQAAGEALAELTNENAKTLFGSGREELLSALHVLSTKTGFSRLGQRFFARFMARFLNFYLSRATASYLGRERLSNIHAVKDFEDNLNLHCQQSARIIYEFCGEWYSKTEFKEGINQNNTNRFLFIAMRKLRLEMEKQEVEL